MSNFLLGIVVGFFLCVWALDASPVTATTALFERVRHIELSFAADHRQEERQAEKVVFPDHPPLSSDIR
ncbi:MAG: hypothetical protein CVT73_11610 [Alphaproteobacteria bacterium HGW-Alphaproteobacteria-12]|nr:MAG: hypothetical protein CVT73_11610 [Alphaproteobacteria bacterium HGW-Alphaproteobacteria-12]